MASRRPRAAQPAHPPFTMAFQPIVDVERREVFAHEALLRGLDGEGALSILSSVPHAQRYAFDHACREKAIGLAKAIGMQSLLSVNFLPNALVDQVQCVRNTVAAAERAEFEVHRMIFEITETERVRDMSLMASTFHRMAHRGFMTAIDDFGAGFAGLELLAAFQPDVIKIDMSLVRDMHLHRPKRAIVRGLVGICRDLGIHVIAEGVEAPEEVQALRTLGVKLFQGYLFARPAIAQEPPVRWLDD